MADLTGDHFNASSSDPEGHNALIGPYKLLQPLGEGSFGKVWMAEQTVPVERIVALKILKAGMDSAQVVARFEQERQVLALLDHPNIARVLDGGTAPSGRPYFVMEYVKGVPITTYCEEQHAGLEQRLRRFIDLCRAIQHAHQKGILHRDLKPGNILVALHEKKPVVKVIDFGIAKVLHKKLIAKTLFTAFGQMLGTPRYMSPEQADIDALDVDTRSDVYSLGVILYELLTGTTPVLPEDLEGASFTEVQRLIRKEVPPRPSARINATSDKKLGLQSVPRDLDVIVMKALSKDRDQRYASADHLAEDIERYLRHEPIQARGPSGVYRLRKFVRRNWGGVLAAGIVLGVLIGGVIGTSMGMLRAQAAEQQTARERERADANYRQARQTIDEFNSRFSRKLADLPGAQPLRKELLESALKFYQTFLSENADDPSLRAEVARTYWRAAGLRQELGEIERAIADYRQAMQIEEALVAEHPERLSYKEALASSCNNLSVLLARHGDADEGLRLLRRAVELRKESVERQPNDAAALSDLASSYNNLGILLEEAGHGKEAHPMHQKALELRGQLVRASPNHSEYIGDLAGSHNNLGAWHYQRGEMGPAQNHYDQALALRERLRARYPRATGTLQEVVKIRYNLTMLHHLTKRPKQAVEHGEQAVALGEELVKGNPAVPEFQRNLADASRALAIALFTAGKHKEALTAMQRCYSLRDRLAESSTHDPDLRALAVAATNFGAMLEKVGRSADAVAPAERAVAVYEQLLKASKPDPKLRASLALAYGNLGAIRNEVGQPEAALIALDQAIAAYLEALKPSPTDAVLREQLAATWSNRGLSLRQLKRDEEKLAACVNAVTLLEPLLASNPGSGSLRMNLTESYAEMAQTHRANNRPTQAAEFASKWRALWPKQPAQLYNVACELARCASRAGEDEQKRLADEAMSTLRQAAAAGFTDAARLAKEPAFAALREREDYKTVVGEMKK